jgi:hypothetical protein
MHHSVTPPLQYSSSPVRWSEAIERNEANGIFSTVWERSGSG